MLLVLSNSPSAAPHKSFIDYFPAKGLNVVVHPKIKSDKKMNLKSTAFWQTALKESIKGKSGLSNTMHLPRNHTICSFFFNGKLMSISSIS